MSYHILPTVLVVLLLSLPACDQASVEPPPFDGDRAFNYLVEQVEFGPRVPGSESSRLCRTYYYEHFGGTGLVVDSQAAEFFDPYSSATIPIVNVIARYDGAGEEASRIVLMAHYDSRPRAEHAVDTSLRSTPIDGANDGASGVAVLMELANLIHEKNPPCNLDLVLVDAEDWGMAGDHEQYLLGSRAFTRSGLRGRYEFGIVVDMVADKDQRFYREGYSEMYNAEVNDMIWETAASLGVDVFVDSVVPYVIDDHLSLNTGGVPAIDIIDFEYEYWHTEFDTPDKCSAKSLSNIGRVLAKIIYNPSSWPKK